MWEAKRKENPLSLTFRGVGIQGRGRNPQADEVKLIFNWGFDFEKNIVYITFKKVTILLIINDGAVGRCDHLFI